jgi:hypothetical protein
MRSDREKLCATEDISQLTTGGDVSCAKCCARSDDPAELCDPVHSKGANLFCD